VAIWPICQGRHERFSKELLNGTVGKFSLLLLKLSHRSSFRFNLDWFANLKIVASNDINEETLYSLKEQVSTLVIVLVWYD